MFLTKNLKPKICSFIARRLIESFEGLNSSLARLAEELYTVVKTRETAWFYTDFKVPIYRTLAANMLI